MDDDMIEIRDDFDDVGPTKHPCSKFFVRAITVITCLHMMLRLGGTQMEDSLIQCRTLSFLLPCLPNSERDDFEDPDATDVLQFLLRWMMFGSFPVLSLLILIITGPMMTIWPHLSQKLVICPLVMHTFCLFSLFYMLLDSMFESFSFIYTISNAQSPAAAPWSSYLLSSLYTLVLWFFFLNFIVNMQLTEFDRRIAHEIAAAFVDNNVVANRN